MRRIFFLLVFLLAALPAGAKKIVFVAGAASHGYGEHEFPAGGALLADALRSAGLGIEVDLHTGGWPEEPGVLDGADAIVVFADGGDGHPIRAHRAEVAGRMADGAGLVLLHYALEVPVGPDAQALQRWVGGFYEAGWSTNPHWRAAVSVADHPIGRGVKPFEVLDEWYFHIRFRDEAAVTPVLTAVPDDVARSSGTWPPGPYEHVTKAAGRRETLLWALEREDGGRGVGFTGGHFHWNWGNDDYRTLVLNALVWAAGGEVPARGVPSSAQGMVDLEAFEPASAWKSLDRWLRFDRDETAREFGLDGPRATSRRRLRAGPAAVRLSLRASAGGRSRSCGTAPSSACRSSGLRTVFSAPRRVAR